MAITNRDRIDCRHRGEIVGNGPVYACRIKGTCTKRDCAICNEAKASDTRRPRKSRPAADGCPACEKGLQNNAATANQPSQRKSGNGREGPTVHTISEMAPRPLDEPAATTASTTAPKPKNPEPADVCPECGSPECAGRFVPLAVTEPIASCPHRGAFREFEFCRACKTPDGMPELVPIFACSLHGVCTPKNHSGVKWGHRIVHGCTGGGCSLVDCFGANQKPNASPAKPAPPAKPTPPAEPLYYRQI